MWLLYHVAGAGEQVDISAPDAHALHMSNALAAKAVPHTLGGAGYQVALVDAVVGPADVHNVSNLLNWHWALAPAFVAPSLTTAVQPYACAESTAGRMALPAG